MRILVTKTGDDIVKELSDEYHETLQMKKLTENYELLRKMSQTNRASAKSNSNSKSPKSNKNNNNNAIAITNANNHRASRNNSNSKNMQSKKNEFLKNTMDKKIELDNKEFIDNEDLLNAKKILIKQKRLHIPKNLTEKYNMDNTLEGTILPDLTINKSPHSRNISVIKQNNLHNINNNLSNFNSYMRSTGINLLANHNNSHKNQHFAGSSYSNGKNSKNASSNHYIFREIISEKAVKDFNKKLEKEEKSRQAMSRVDESNFRSVYGQLNKKEKFEKLLNSTINANKATLIKYINQKQNISDVFIKKINDSSEDKIIKTNKICQMVFHEQEKIKLLNDKINEKIESQKKKELGEYKINLEQMGETLRDFSSILNDYSSKSSHNRSRYKELHNEIVTKHWKRFNLDRLMYKTKQNFMLKHMDSAGNLSKTFGSFNL